MTPFQLQRLQKVERDDKIIMVGLFAMQTWCVFCEVGSDFLKIVCVNSWIDLTQDRDQWRPLVNTVMNLRVP
jgi:hypothetical protein